MNNILTLKNVVTMKLSKEEAQRCRTIRRQLSQLFLNYNLGLITLADLKIQSAFLKGELSNYINIKN